MSAIAERSGDAPPLLEHLIAPIVDIAAARVRDDEDAGAADARRLFAEGDVAFDAGEHAIGGDADEDDGLGAVASELAAERRAAAFDVLPAQGGAGGAYPLAEVDDADAFFEKQQLLVGLQPASCEPALVQQSPKGIGRMRKMVCAASGEGIGIGSDEDDAEVVAEDVSDPRRGAERGLCRLTDR